MSIKPLFELDLNGSETTTGCFKSSFRLKVVFCMKHFMFFRQNSAGPVNLSN